MSTPTKAEKAWMSKLEKLLMNPPSERLGLFTIGDAELIVYDLNRESEINNLLDRRETDFCCAVHELDARLGRIGSSVNIHSTSG